MIQSKLFPSLLLVGALAYGFAATPAQAQGLNVGNGIVITDVDIAPGAISIVDNVLRVTEGTVSGTIAGRAFTTDITNFALQLVDDDPDTTPVECSVLDLELAPINLALLGLHVDTSPICLEITATEGGGLLGDLLCSLAGDGPLGLPVLPTATELLALQAGLTDVIAGALGQTLEAVAHNDESVCTGDCEVLELVLGPVDLSLLGLNVRLDDCDDGPVQVCVSATATEGLLGGLLCGLAGGGLLDLDLLEQLLGALPLGDLAGLNVPTKQVGQLANEVSRLLRDGELTNNELSRFTKSVNKLIRKY